MDFLDDLKADYDYWKHKDDPSLGVAAGATGLGAASLMPSVDRALGAAVVYHGTKSPEALESIRQQGLLTARGGEGAARMSPQYVQNSLGQVHVTSSKPMANFMSRASQADFDAPGDPLKGIRKHKPHIAQITLPYDEWKKFEIDPDFARHGTPDSIKRYLATRTNQDIDPKFLRGRMSSLGSLARQLPSYIRNNPKRFALGLAGLGVSGKLLHTGATEGVNYLQDKLG